MPQTAGYPAQWEADVVLRDGGTVHVRPITPEDGPALQAFHVRQSERSTYFRFFARLDRLPDRDLERFTHVDHRDRVALVAVASEPAPDSDDPEPVGRAAALAPVPSDPTERIIAVARYDRIEPTVAEVAFNVADDHHGRGLGSVLLEHLAVAARERGIHRFTAEVLPQNGQMLGIFREAGYQVSQHIDDGIVSVSFDIDPTARSLAVTADREQRAEARSVAGFLAPRSVLVVAPDSAPATSGEDQGGSASDRSATTPERALAQEVLTHLRAADGPEVHVVGGLELPGADGDGPDGIPQHTWPDVSQVPGPVDLLVLAVPADRAAAMVRRCARLAPRAVVVLSSGFAETGPAGLAHQRELVRSAHAAGMRVVGPASFGFVRHGADEPATVNASLATVVPRPGRLGLFCQSAPLAVGLLDSAHRRGLGLSTFLSSGNRADVSGNDLMQFWGTDDQTDVIGLYLESIGNPRKFTRVARRLATSKPVVVLTAGRSGHVLPPGQALRLTRVPRRALEEILRQAGVIRVESQHQLLDVSQLLVHQPLPAGGRVTVLASSAPLAALVAEAAVSAGLTVGDQRAILPGGGNDEADLSRLSVELEEVYADPGCDAVVVVHIPTVGPADDRVAHAVARAAAGSGRTTVACLLGLRGVTTELTALGPDGSPQTVPAYAAPEDGVVALAAAARYSAWRGADHGVPLAPDGIDRTGARRLVEDALTGAAGEPLTLPPESVSELLRCYGVDVWPTVVVTDGPEAVHAAEQLGWPVALKASADRLRHRLDLGGVRLDLASPTTLLDAVEQMREHLRSLGVDRISFEVQRMAAPGAPCVIRTSEDPRFGPVVSFGLAGDATDLLDDVSHGVAPLTDVDVAEMIRNVRAAPRLFGYRNLPAVDVAALEDVLGRVSVLADDLPEVHSLELHPVVAAQDGAAVLSAKIELAEAGRADGARRMLPQ